MKEKPSDALYDLQSLKAPRLAGLALRIFANLMERAPTRALILPKLLKDSGFEDFRADEPEEAPTVFPLVIPDTPPQKYRELSAAQLTKIAKAGAAKPAANKRKPTFEGEFVFPTTLDYHAAYKSKRISPVDVAGRLIAAIESSNAGDRPMRAIIQSKTEDILRQAEASAERWKKGKPLGPLDGVPVAVKDEVDQLGYATTVGTSWYGREVARTDSTVVHRLRERGALLYGKANMHEIGIGVNGNNPHHGVARNPYDEDHYTGGSSSGSGAAVAMGLGPFAVGADGGGSVRIPAAFCGLVGLKATFGRVSEAGAAPLCWSVAHVGPLAATAADCALAYAAFAGPDSLDPVSMRQPLPEFGAAFEKNSVRGIRIGVFEPWFRHADYDIVKANEEMLKVFEQNGARRRKIVIPHLNSLRVAHTVSIASEMAASFEDEYKRHRTDFGLDVRVNLAVARTFTSRDYVRAQRIRTRAMADFARAFYEVDAIVTPATAITAPPIRPDAVAAGESDLETLSHTMRFAVQSNMTGHPAIVFPVGYDQRGLPISMQIIGRHWDEALLLRMARFAEAYVPRKKPRTWFSLLEG